MKKKQLLKKKLKKFCKVKKKTVSLQLKNQNNIKTQK